jgi:hypothetical protein
MVQTVHIAKRLSWRTGLLAGRVMLNFLALRREPGIELELQPSDIREV